MERLAFVVKTCVRAGVKPLRLGRSRSGERLSGASGGESGVSTTIACKNLK